MKKGKNNVKVKFMAVAVTLTLVLSLVLTLAGPVSASPIYDVSGTWNITVEYLTVNYAETLVLTQTGGNITGVSLDSIPPVFSSAFTITGGSVSGNAIVFHAAYNPNNLETVTFTGTIANSGSMSGTWTDDPGFLGRTGTWVATKTTGTRLVIGAITAPTISMVAPGTIDFGQFTFSIPKIQQTASYGSVTVVPGSATNVNWSVTAADVGPGSAWGYMKLGGVAPALTNPLYISNTNGGWSPAITGFTTTGTNNSTTLDFWGAQTVVPADAAGTYSTVITFTVAITSFN